MVIQRMAVEMNVDYGVTCDGDGGIDYDNDNEDGVFFYFDGDDDGR